MSYNLKEWTKFVQEDLDRFTVIELPVTMEAFRVAIPGSKPFCTIANALSLYTGMDARQCHIEVEVKYIKFILDGKRYFLIQEVAGAEHIRNLDQLAFAEKGEAKFEPFILKLRYHDEKELHIRPRRSRPQLVPSAEMLAASTEKTLDHQSSTVKSETAITPPPRRPAPAAVSTRPPRADAGRGKKTRWAR